MASSAAKRAANRLRDETNAFDRRNRDQYDEWASLRVAIIEAITELERLARIGEPTRD